MLNYISLCLSAAALSLFFLSITPAESAQAHSINMQVPGVLKPLREATLSSDILSRIDFLPVKEGSYFKKGDLLVRLDCMRYKTNQWSTIRKFKNRYSKLDTPQFADTDDEGSGPNYDHLSPDTAQLDTKIASANAAMRSCLIRAPWNGRVVKVMVHPYETVKPGDALLQILDDSMLDVDFQVPSSWLTSIKVGMPFRFHVKDTGKDYFPKITSIGARVDQATETIHLTGSMIKSHVALLAGMHGTAEFGKFTPKMSISPATLYVLLHKQYRLQCAM